MSYLLRKLTGGGKNEGLALTDRDVHLLQNGDGESGGLSGTGLGLGDNIVALDTGDDGTLLDSRRLLETVGIDTTEKILTQVHVIKTIDNLIPVGLHRENRQIVISSHAHGDSARTQGHPLLTPHTSMMPSGFMPAGPSSMGIPPAAAGS